MGDVHSWANVGIGALVLICAATGVAVAARAPRAVAGCADVAQAPLNVLPSHKYQTQLHVLKHCAKQVIHQLKMQQAPVTWKPNHEGPQCSFRLAQLIQVAECTRSQSFSQSRALCFVNQNACPPRR